MYYPWDSNSSNLKFKYKIYYVQKLFLNACEM